MTAPIRANRRSVPLAIRDRVPFANSTGSLTGYVGHPGTVGQMPEPWREQYLVAIGTRSVVYTVVSYSTPIAWLLDSGEWIIPDHRYSQTTSCHQGLARYGASMAQAVAA